MTLIRTLLDILKGRWSALGLRAECGEKVTASVLIRNKEISLTGFAGVGLRDVENVLHELTAIMLREKRASIGLARYPHYITAAAPLEPKLFRAAWASATDKKSFFTTGIKLILPETFSVTVAADEDAIHCVFGSAKPMVDGPLAFDYLVNQCWVRESGIDVELSDRSRHKKTWAELGFATSPTQAELKQLAAKNPPPPEWFEGEEENPFAIEPIDQERLFSAANYVVVYRGGSKEFNGLHDALDYIRVDSERNGWRQYTLQIGPDFDEDEGVPLRTRKTE